MMKRMLWCGALGALFIAGCGKTAGSCDDSRDCPAGQVCLVDHRCQAPPVMQLSVARTGDGEGTVVSEPAGISCGQRCDFTFPPGTPVRLSATAGPRSVFQGWSGGCSGTASCELSRSGQVLAAFARVAEAPRATTAPRPMCISQCREVARACKGSCKLRHPRGPGRHDCALGCEVNEHECRARARC